MAVVGSWTYSGDPRDSDRDAVRFLVQDTNENDQKVSDEEIAWMLSNSANIYLAAADIAVTISAVYGSKAKKSIGSLSIEYSQQREAYEALSERLRALGKSSSRLALTNVFAGGISKSDKELQRTDTDWDRPWFERDAFNYPNSLDDIYST